MTMPRPKTLTKAECQRRRRKRDKASISMLELAVVLGIAESTVQRWETSNISVKAGSMQDQAWRTKLDELISQDADRQTGSR